MRCQNRKPHNLGRKQNEKADCYAAGSGYDAGSGCMRRIRARRYREDQHRSEVERSARRLIFQ